MSANFKHRAPWCRALKIISVAASALCIGLFCLRFTKPLPIAGMQPVYWMSLLLPLLVLAAVLFIVRGYAIEGGALLVERLVWTTRLPLDGLLSATIEPRAMRTCLRTCGNGGMFSFTGWYWSRPLGHFRAFVTDLNRTVVLRFANRTLVVSPENSEEFVREISHRVG